MLPSSPDRKLRPALGGRLAALSVILFCCFATLGICQTQSRSILCLGGDGTFHADFRTGVTLHAGPARNGRLATRACAATFVWYKQDLIVATDVSQLDVDAFGVDFGDGTPAAAFQFKKRDSDCCMEYEIYSLQQPPRLVRAITGGNFFSASDVDLDGKIEIWTTDAAAVSGFENLALIELDSAPTVILRFARGQLVDASAEFQPYFDQQVTKVRAETRPQDLDDFRGSDGKLAANPTISAERLHRLRMTKIKVLEVVWAYLYSGREQEAWHSLAEMWPPADVDRVRAAIVNIRARGIHGQADATSAGASPVKGKRVPIYDATDIPEPGHTTEVVPPRAILLQRPHIAETQQQGWAESESLLDLVIDSAGKVRSVEPAGRGRSVAPELIQAALSWKFVPAYKNGQPVASRVRLAVSPRQ
jgi:hypothetical protein